jgi:hypothetical protein
VRGPAVGDIIPENLESGAVRIISKAKIIQTVE